MLSLFHICNTYCHATVLFCLDCVFNHCSQWCFLFSLTLDLFFSIHPILFFLSIFSRGYSSNKSWQSSSSKGAGRGSKASAWGAAAGRRPGILTLPSPQTNQRPFLKPTFAQHS